MHPHTHTHHHLIVSHRPRPITTPPSHPCECRYGNVNTLLKDVTRRNKVPEGRCNLACVGNKMQMCGGGSGAISLYSIATATQVA